VAGLAAGARAAVEAVARTTTSVRLLYSVLVPEDETCFCVYEAESKQALRNASRVAGVDFERISRAFELGPAAPRAASER
jgi:Protein of unknown function (DUF4242)